MSWSTDFEALMPDTVVVSGLSSFSTDGYMTPTYGSGSTYKARVVRKLEMVRTFEGTEELATTVAWVASTSTFGPSDRVTVNSTQMGPIMATESFPDEDGIHHVKLYFGN